MLSTHNYLHKLHETEADLRAELDLMSCLFLLQGEGAHS